MMRAREILVAAVAAAAILLLTLAVPWLRFVFTIAIAKGITVLGILVLLRAGQVSFGHALYLSFGAYIVAFAAPFCPEALLLLPLAALGATLLGLVIGLFVSRYRDIFFGMLNLALSMVFYSTLEKFYSITHGTDGIRLARTTFLGMTLTPETQAWTALGLALLLAAVFAILVRIYLESPMGHGLSAIKTREARLEFMGISAQRVLLAAYVLSAFMAGCGGFIVAMATRQVTPSLAYWTASGELVFIAILGGTGSVLGPFLGAIAYELTRVYAAALFAEGWQMILGAVLLLVILFAPGGLWSILRRMARQRVGRDARP
ncbi:MAG: branched-chain amino acid ABC transporter permease [Xanthobacteraceae bacterium]|nr:branched-chain amino acid ABC transporter permease [Xanthobacteraceae bacterium]